MTTLSELLLRKTPIRYFIWPLYVVLPVRFLPVLRALQNILDTSRNGLVDLAGFTYGEETSLHEAHTGSLMRASQTINLASQNLGFICGLAPLDGGWLGIVGAHARDADMCMYLTAGYV